ncbi:GNAT family N-acetyltransferase [Massilia putida]|uniref:GNAT family N-acetyltransferase n=1 Tax=Massilia putida TaxID=1141883 RepID=UPI00095256DD|nr:GNAT family N-acetyltransferase [Massilia putida]
MHDEFPIEVQADVKSADVNTIVKALTEFNASHAGGDTPHYLVITVRDRERNVVGGLVGATYLGWLQIQAVWISEALRGKGYGTRLMRQAEDQARERRCPRVFLETLSFQALPFYEKLGYQVVSRIADFPPGGARYALTKMLDRDE